ncbi:hypothetical protein Vau01_085150 [Virgisporangium aurantiacum]|uniref:Uncharacterized protein n=1 Tax=Virgisporangium aurantiacum TaxID=175570 RepID=A0A8J4E4E9_9ACTN|nr:hypothetical protein Vau01_085150 [Virgisporangium aurantiacum]
MRASGGLSPNAPAARNASTAARTGDANWRSVRVARVFGGDDEAAGRGVPVGQRRRDVVDRSARDGRRVQLAQPLVDGALPEDLGEFGGQRPCPLASPRERMLHCGRPITRVQNFSLATPTTSQPSLASNTWNGTNDGCAECRVRAGSKPAFRCHVATSVSIDTAVS